MQRSSIPCSHIYPQRTISFTFPHFLIVIHSKPTQLTKLNYTKSKITGSINQETNFQAEEDLKLQLITNPPTQSLVIHFKSKHLHVKTPKPIFSLPQKTKKKTLSSTTNHKSYIHTSKNNKSFSKTPRSLFLCSGSR